jgi:leucyl/phenylalanyl-tRNA--protein transferase
MNIFPLSGYSITFPDPLLADEQGIVAYGGDLSVNRIMKGYSCGIFPWYKQGDPILWWSPDPRFVLKLDRFHIPKSLNKIIDKNIFEVRFDHNFEEVIKNCAAVKRKDQEGSWLTPEMIQAYIQLYKAGFAHSFEAYSNGKLAGGGYGVVIGDIFCGESMFTKESNASKVAFAALVQRLKNKGFNLIDSQIYTEHFAVLGACEISREEYLHQVNQALQNPKEF